MTPDADGQHESRQVAGPIFGAKFGPRTGPDVIRAPAECVPTLLLRTVH